MFTRTMQSAALAFLFVAATSAADSPFTGTWKLNADESKLTGLRLKIQNLGGNKYKFIFGDDSQTIVADGTDQPNKYGGTWSVKQEGSNTWKEVDKRDGKITSTSTWALSDDGQRLEIKTEGTRADGSSFTDEMKTKRTAGTSGLVGTWESTDMKIGSPTDWQIQPYDGNGLTFLYPSSKEQLDIKFDGKDYASRGPRTTPGATSSGRRVDDRTLDITVKLKGKVIEHDEYKVSEDAKKLTLTAHYPGIETPQTIVYDRQ
jgi:hypothetical protein